MRRLARAAAILFAATGCGEPTAIILVVETDLCVPDEADTLGVTAESGGALQSSIAAIDLTDGTAAVPFVHRLVSKSGDGEVVITATVLLGETAVVTRTATVALAPGETRVLHLVLDRNCVGVVCDAGATCADGICRDARVAAGTLPPFSGEIDGIDRTGQAEWCACATNAACANRVVELAAGSAHTCALHQGGEVRCWGQNSFGELGFESDGAIQSSAGIPVVGLRDAVRIDAAFEASCAARRTGRVVCWGEPQSPEGTGGPELRDIGAPTRAAQPVLAVGQWYACGLDASSARCVGSNMLGMLGSADAELARSTLALDGAIAADAGADHACAVTERQAVACWGFAEHGKLGQGVVGPEPGQVRLSFGALDVAAGYDHTCVVAETAAVWCWGYNGHGQLGTPDSLGEVPQEVVSIGDVCSTRGCLAAGGEHTCAVLADGSVSCWGRNQRGQAGGPDATASNPHAVPDALGTGTLEDVVGIAAGGAHTCAIQLTGGVVCWGFNEYGGLGDGTTVDSDYPRPVMGLP